MDIDAIGTALTSNQNGAANSIDLESFLRLFITQLTYQDPLEPTSNEEFLAQMAQFAGLEQQRQLSEGMSGMLTMNSSSQAVGLLGRSVMVDQGRGPAVGEVTAIRFLGDGPSLTLTLGNDRGVLTNVRLSQIRLVQ